MGMCYDTDEIKGVRQPERQHIAAETRRDSFRIYDEHTGDVEFLYTDLPDLLATLRFVADKAGVDPETGRPVLDP
jgi:hypothetical protein